MKKLLLVMIAICSPMFGCDFARFNDEMYRSAMISNLNSAEKAFSEARFDDAHMFYLLANGAYSCLTFEVENSYSLRISIGMIYTEMVLSKEHSINIQRLIDILDMMDYRKGEVLINFKKVAF